MNNETETKTGRGGKFLTFYLMDEEYGIEIHKVQEIIGMLPITRVPRVPDFVRGVVNLRGKIIPVTNLRHKFDMEDCPDSSETCIIVVRTYGIEIGVIVDKVSEVLDILDTEIEDAPSFGADINTDYLLGIGKTQGNVRLLLDIDRILIAKEVSQMMDVVGAAEVATA